MHNKPKNEIILTRKTKKKTKTTERKALGQREIDRVRERESVCLCVRNITKGEEEQQQQERKDNTTDKNKNNN